MMEGISHEACSLAGTLGLGKLIAFWDDNGITIDGHVEGWFTDDTPKRFEAYGWHVIPGVDGHDADALNAAIEAAKAVTDKPTLICCKTTIGFGSPNLAGTHDCHGAPLGDDEIKLTREQLDWNYGPFEIPEDIYAGWDAKDAWCSRRVCLEREVRRLRGRTSRAGRRVQTPHGRRTACQLGRGIQQLSSLPSMQRLSPLRPARPPRTPSTVTVRYCLSFWAALPT